MDLNILSKHRNELYGLCAFWIVLFHAVVYFDFWPSSHVLFLDSLRWFFTKSYGVDAFVLLSGLSLFFSYYKDPSPGRFIKKRIKRVMPALLLTFGIKWILLIASGSHELPWLLWHLSLVPFCIDGNTDGAWFFSFILLLYFAYPYIHSFIYSHDATNKRSVRAVALRVCLLCVITCLIYWLIHKYSLDWFWKIEIGLARVPIFIVGCFIGYLIKMERSHLSDGATTTLLVLGVMWLYLIVGPVKALSVWWYRLIGSFGGLFLTIVLALSIEVIAKHACLRHALRPLCLAGSCSLELYGAHIVLYRGVWFVPPLEGSHVQLVIYTIVALLWSWIDVRYLEPRLLSAARRVWHRIQ